MPKIHEEYYKKEVYKELYILGFKKKYVKTLINIFSDYIWYCYDEDAYLSAQHVIDDIVDTIDTDIDTVLQNMRAKYKMLYISITKDIKHHYSTWHLVQIIIEYANGRFNPISTNAFLYNPTIENEWFRNEKQMLCYNAKTREDVKESIKYLSSQIEPGCQLFFHATNWKNINRILEIGPKHNRGRARMDFGNRESFYMTPNINISIEYATRACFNNEGGIVVFALSLTSLVNIKKFQSPDDKWKSLVKNSRKCQKENNELDTYNFVYGPMLKNGYNIQKANVEAEAHSPIRWQLASKNDVSDKILKNAMIGVVFLKRDM